MPRPSYRTRSRKRVKVKVPGGRLTIHYKREKAKHARCSKCGKPLSGIPRMIPSEIRKLNRTRRRISRMFGGQLCAQCLKTSLKQAIRAL
jgi:large subunit ribosomal protein L34e